MLGRRGALLEVQLLLGMLLGPKLEAGHCVIARQEARRQHHQAKPLNGNL